MDTEHLSYLENYEIQEEERTIWLQCAECLEEYEYAGQETCLNCGSDCIIRVADSEPDDENICLF